METFQALGLELAGVVHDAASDSMIVLTEPGIAQTIGYWSFDPLPTTTETGLPGR